MKKLLAYLFLFCLVFAITGGLGYYGVSLFTHSQESVVMPSFVGKNIIYVLETMTQMGLNPKLMGTQYHDTIQEYNITFQKPEPGTIIKTGRDVSIYISKGKQNVLLPDLIHTPLPEAKLILERQEFSPGVISKTFSAMIPKDHIIAQSPRPFTPTDGKRICHLLVSRGPAPVPMPDILGDTMEEAMKKLSQKGLQSPEMYQRISGKKLQGKVMEQQPLPGVQVFPHTPITIIAGVAYPDSWKDFTQKGFFVSHTLPRGFLKRQVRLEMDLGGTTLVLMNEYKKPGKIIDLLLPGGVKTCIRIFIDGILVRQKYLHPDSLNLQKNAHWQFLEEIPQGFKESWTTGENLWN